ncbi:hypothetical protein NPIL_429191 [Nephila pilipes]|uniref:Uncharacterized protein n=1 Tax=Nephila pilipes TaxID=299642 RepID=A0A8X6Q6I5_NEPPI|nr:hypothetical protein NPIL_429191 [Nephila pilipes]
MLSDSGAVMKRKHGGENFRESHPFFTLIRGLYHTDDVTKDASERVEQERGARGKGWDFCCMPRQISAIIHRRETEKMIHSITQ